MLRLVCTVTWVDPGNNGGLGGHHYGGSWKRRKSFKTWLHHHQARRSVYHRARWALSLLSPYNILTMIIKWIQTCAMAGQFCDASAANGVASVAMMGGTDDHMMIHHHSSKGSLHSHGQYGSLFGPYPQSNDVHAAVILSLARSW